jgi:hypothetical protein
MSIFLETPTQFERNPLPFEGFTNYRNVSIKKIKIPQRNTES